MLNFLSPLVRRTPGGRQKSLARYHVLPLGNATAKIRIFPETGNICHRVFWGHFDFTRVSQMAQTFAGGGGLPLKSQKWQT